MNAALSAFLRELADHLDTSGSLWDDSAVQLMQDSGLSRANRDKLADALSRIS